jgi:hypothetical protein
MKKIILLLLIEFFCTTWSMEQKSKEKAEQTSEKLTRKKEEDQKSDTAVALQKIQTQLVQKNLQEENQEKAKENLEEIIIISNIIQKNLLSKNLNFYTLFHKKIPNKLNLKTWEEVHQQFFQKYLKNEEQPTIQRSIRYLNNLNQLATQELITKILRGNFQEICDKFQIDLSLLKKNETNINKYSQIINIHTLFSKELSKKSPDFS